MFLIPNMTDPDYGPNTKWGGTFRRFMRSMFEALQGSYYKTRHLDDIRKFRVTLPGGARYNVEIHPRHYMISVMTVGGKGVRTTEFDDILEPILKAIEAANLTDNYKGFPSSDLKQATKEEHEFSHWLNSP